MEEFDTALLQTLYKPPEDSHKGQNGKLLLIGGSHLFHAASLWALGTASRLVDMVFYASVPENNAIVQQAKAEFRDGIVVERQNVESYVEEADCVLIGPGMVRSEMKNERGEMRDLEAINNLENEGEQTYYLTKYLLAKYPHKKWVIDAGALQMTDTEWLKNLSQVIVTPHHGEFERVFQEDIKNQSASWRTKIKNGDQSAKIDDELVAHVAKKYGTIILLKGVEDVVCSPDSCVSVSGGNAGMTKGGTGDVLAGLVAALSCKNDMYLAAQCGSYINKRAGDELYKRVGSNFNASGLMMEIPRVMQALLR